MRNHRCTVVLAGMLASTAVSAQELRPESLQLYGGTYATNCRDAAAPSVKIGAAGLVVSHGARSMRTPARMDSYTRFGGAPTSVVPEATAASSSATISPSTCSRMARACMCRSRAMWPRRR